MGSQGAGTRPLTIGVPRGGILAPASQCVSMEIYGPCPRSHLSTRDRHQSAADRPGLGRARQAAGLERVWNPRISDQGAQVRSNPPPWNGKAAKEVQQIFAEENAGRPRLIFFGCFPEGMPSWMLITHNALEILFTPGRVTLLGESDGSRLRRIYTDGRPHPDYSDPTWHGHSIGHWTATRWWWTRSIFSPKCRSPSARRSACRTTATCTSSSTGLGV
jgi:hypothetical protein